MAAFACAALLPASRAQQPVLALVLAGLGLGAALLFAVLARRSAAISE